MEHKTDWLYNKKWGVMFHYLEAMVNHNYKFTKGEQPLNWNDCVEQFDVEKFAKQMHDIGAGYVMFTLTQGTRFFCAPNSNFDKISGYKPGEACSRRDLVMDLCDELAKYDIDFLAYFTADGPYADEKACKAFGFYREKEDVHTQYLEKWASVIEEYSLRYGNKIKGWWFDGCHQMMGFDDEKMKYIAYAARAGNKDTLLALNTGPCVTDLEDVGIAELIKDAKCNYEKIENINKAAENGNIMAIKSHENSLYQVSNLRWSKYEDFTAGEVSEMDQYPNGRFVEGSQWHILAGLGISENKNTWYGRPTWSETGGRYSNEYLCDYLKKVHEKGGVVSIGMYISRDGSLDNGQVAQLKAIKNLL